MWQHGPRPRVCRLRSRVADYSPATLTAARLPGRRRDRKDRSTPGRTHPGRLASLQAELQRLLSPAPPAQFERRPAPPAKAIRRNERREKRSHSYLLCCGRRRHHFRVQCRSPGRPRRCRTHISAPRRDPFRLPRDCRRGASRCRGRTVMRPWWGREPELCRSWRRLP